MICWQKLPSKLERMHNKRYPQKDEKVVLTHEGRGHEGQNIHKEEHDKITAEYERRE